jgi:glycosyltransferase involved in cell wall biosynthesis
MPPEHSAVPPRICMLLESYFPVVGGMETQAVNMTCSFKKEGMPVLIVTRRSSPELAPHEIIDGTPVYRVGPTTRSSRARWIMVLSALPTLFRLRREYDLILVPGFRALGITAVFIQLILGKPAVLKAESCGEMSGDFFKGGLQNIKLGLSSWPVRLFLKLRNSFLARAKAFVSLSADMTAEYLSSGVPPARLHVIAQSVDVDRFHPVDALTKRALREKLGLPVEHTLIIFSGRLVSYKGLPNLLNVWETLAAEFPKATLIIAGAGGVDIFNCESQIKQFVVEHGLKDRVIFTGAVKNVNEYLQASDIFAFPTENEAFPLALLEALSAGLAAIGTTVGGIPDVLKDEENGLIIPPADGIALTRALRRLMENPEWRAKLIAGAQKTVREKYTRAIITDQYARLFNLCLPPPNPSSK